MLSIKSDQNSTRAKLPNGPNENEEFLIRDDRINFEGMSASLASFTDWHWWYQGREKIFSEVIAAEDTSNIPKRILCLGSIEGFEEQFISPSDRTIHINDVTEELSVDPSTKKAMSSIQTNVPPIPLNSRSVDQVFCLDLLEHVTNDGQLLEEIHRVLVPGGRVFLSVPAFEWFWTRHDERVGHERRYKRSELTECARSYGFEVSRSTYFNLFLFPLVLAGKWFIPRTQEMFGPNRSRNDYSLLDKNRPGRLNSLLKTIFGSEAYFIQRFSLPFGLSIFFILKKSN
jgi:SAM-dependent methyltransferase